uniref:Uncharacterized protein n=1 Tax=Anguilla anguilla TaxID=7936 RepID=A0A0E9V2Y3_ANGAN
MQTPHRKAPAGTQNQGPSCYEEIQVIYLLYIAAPHLLDTEQTVQNDNG